MYNSIVILNIAVKTMKTKLLNLQMWPDEKFYLKLI